NGAICKRYGLGTERFYVNIWWTLAPGCTSRRSAGPRRVFVIGLVLFGSASFMVGAAETQIWLIGSRAFQGVGAAIVAPSSLSPITAIFPAGPPRTRAVAAYGTTAGIGASLGMVIGGALASWVSWRAGFFLNVPLVALLVIAALL